MATVYEDFIEFETLLINGMSKLSNCSLVKTREPDDTNVVEFESMLNNVLPTGKLKKTAGALATATRFLFNGNQFLNYASSVGRPHLLLMSHGAHICNLFGLQKIAFINWDTEHEKYTVTVHLKTTHKVVPKTVKIIKESMNIEVDNTNITAVPSDKLDKTTDDVNSSKPDITSGKSWGEITDEDISCNTYETPKVEQNSTEQYSNDLRKSPIRIYDNYRDGNNNRGRGYGYGHSRGSYHVGHHQHENYNNHQFAPQYNLSPNMSPNMHNRGPHNTYHNPHNIHHGPPNTYHGPHNMHHGPPINTPPSVHQHIEYESTDNIQSNNSSRGMRGNAPRGKAKYNKKKQTPNDNM